MTELETIAAQNDKILEILSDRGKNLASIEKKIDGFMYDVKEWQVSHQRSDDTTYTALNSNINNVSIKLETFDRHYKGVGIVGVFVGACIAWILKLMGKDS